MLSRVFRCAVLAVIVIAAPVVVFAAATLAYKLYYWAARLMGTGNYEYIATCGVLMVVMVIVCVVIVKCLEY